jgi:hypothetical protein
MTENTHRYTFAGSIETMGDARSLNATWAKIADAFEIMEKIVKDAGGTLTCTPQRIGKSKAAPSAPSAPSAPTSQSETANSQVGNSDLSGINAAMTNADAPVEPTPLHGRRGHGGTPPAAAE